MGGTTFWGSQSVPQFPKCLSIHSNKDANIASIVATKMVPQQLYHFIQFLVNIHPEQNWSCFSEKQSPGSPFGQEGLFPPLLPSSHERVRPVPGPSSALSPRPGLCRRTMLWVPSEGGVKTLCIPAGITEELKVPCAAVAGAPGISATVRDLH